MKIAIIGRTELLYDTALRLRTAGHQITCILTAKEAPEYTRTAEDFRALADAWQIPFVQGGPIMGHADFLRDALADIAVSINYTGIVPQSVIDLFPLGVLNAHGGDLPRYRGNACQAWAIINGEESIGLCIHRMVGGELDSGDIIARDHLAINHTTKVTNVLEWMSLRTPELILKAVQMLQDDPSYILQQQSKDPTRALRCYPRKPEDGRINWNKPAIDVLRLVNATNRPYSGAFCEFEGKNLIIWDAELVQGGEIFCAVPGQVTKIGNGYIEVACGFGKLRCLRVQLSSDIVSPDSFIRSVRQRLT
jgi:methionyl-tRNA formyltransferase